MDMHFDTDEWAVQPVRDGQAIAVLTPDWQSLAARLRAARAANRAMGATVLGAPVAVTASFDRKVARVVAGFPRKLGGVNLLCSVGGKGTGDMLASVAGHPDTGDRG